MAAFFLKYTGSALCAAQVPSTPGPLRLTAPLDPSTPLSLQVPDPWTPYEKKTLDHRDPWIRAEGARTNEMGWRSMFCRVLGNFPMSSSSCFCILFALLLRLGCSQPTCVTNLTWPWSKLGKKRSACAFKKVFVRFSETWWKAATTTISWCFQSPCCSLFTGSSFSVNTLVSGAHSYYYYYYYSYYYYLYYYYYYYYY